MRTQCPNGVMTGRKGILEAGGVLDRIVEAKAIRVAELRRGQKMSELVAGASGNSAPARRSLIEALRNAGRINIIAEIKHRSPSQGVIREDFNPASIASSYEEAGAAAISVLTEEDFFGGSLEHLRTVRQTVNLPVLRKDFIFDENQIYEASAAGADAILLIVAILDDGLLADLIGLSSELKIESLVEVHNARRDGAGRSRGCSL